MSWPPERVSTPRLQLRKPQPGDAEAVFARLSGDAEVTRYLGWQTHADLARTRQQISHDLHRWQRGAAWTWMIDSLVDEVGDSADDAQAIGMIQLVASDHGWRLGFLLQQASWGKGFAVEAASAVADSAFRQPQVHRIDAVCDVDNMASASALQKLGMQYEGCLRRYILHPNVSPAPRDVFIYAMTRSP